MKKQKNKEGAINRVRLTNYRLRRAIDKIVDDIREFFFLLGFPLALGVVYLIPEIILDKTTVIQIPLLVILGMLCLMFADVLLKEDEDESDTVESRQELRDVIIVLMIAIGVMRSIDSGNMLPDGPIFILWLVGIIVLFLAATSLVLISANWNWFRRFFLISCFYLAKQVLACWLLTFLIIETFMHLGSPYVLLPALMTFPFAWIIGGYQRLFLIRTFGQEIFSHFLDRPWQEKVFKAIFLLPTLAAFIDVNRQLLF